MSKKPRFFCDNCGFEVNKDTKACPQCWRFFASVRCPSCGFSGAEKIFSNGCPSCGYSAAPSTVSSENIKNRKKKNTGMPTAPLPSFVYISILVLLIIVAILAFLITR